MRKGNSLSKKVMAARTWSKPNQTEEEAITTFLQEKVFKASKQDYSSFAAIYSQKDELMMRGSAQEIIDKYSGTEYEYRMTKMEIGGHVCYATINFLRQLQKAYEEKQQQEEYKKLSEGSEL